MIHEDAGSGRSGSPLAGSPTPGPPPQFAAWRTSESDIVSISGGTESMVAFGPLGGGRRLVGSLGRMQGDKR